MGVPEGKKQSEGTNTKNLLKNTFIKQTKRSETTYFLRIQTLEKSKSIILVKSLDF